MRLTYPLKCKDYKHLPLNLRLEEPLSEYYLKTYIKNIIYSIPVEIMMRQKGAFINFNEGTITFGLYLDGRLSLGKILSLPTCQGSHPPFSSPHITQCTLWHVDQVEEGIN